MQSSRVSVVYFNPTKSITLYSLQTNSYLADQGIRGKKVLFLIIYTFYLTYASTNYRNLVYSTSL